jgi:hypothetical protein
MGAETRVLRDEAFLPHIGPRKVKCDVLARFERAIARQHGSRHEESSIPAVEEHPECRYELKSSPDGHNLEIITRHAVPSLLAPRFPAKNREGVRGARSRGQAQSPANRVASPLDGPVFFYALRRRPSSASLSTRERNPATRRGPLSPRIVATREASQLHPAEEFDRASACRQRRPRLFDFEQ